MNVPVLSCRYVERIWSSLIFEVMLVWACAAFPSEATFSAWTGMDFCAIWGTSVTSGSFPQYDLSPALKCAHTLPHSVPAIHCSFVFGVLLKASCLFSFPISDPLLHSKQRDIDWTVQSHFTWIQWKTHFSFPTYPQWNLQSFPGTSWKQWRWTEK